MGATPLRLKAKWNSNFTNVETVIGIENNSRNSIAHTLDGVIEFMNFKHKDMAPKYKVFKELFVICWAGITKKSKNKTYLSRVDIELVNEQIKLFYSSQDVVEIFFDDDSFTIIEYVPLGLNDQMQYYPLEKQTLHFFDNGYYKIETEFLFQPPEFDKKILFHTYNSNLALLKKMNSNQPLTSQEQKDLLHLPYTFMICYLNGFEKAKQNLIDAKTILKPFIPVYLSFKEALRVLRKMKYDT